MDVTYCWDVAVIALFSMARRRDSPAILLLLHLKSPFGREVVADFCVLASCWHRKSEPVAPSGASSTAAPGTGCAGSVGICSEVSALAALCWSVKGGCSPSPLLVY